MYAIFMLFIAFFATTINADPPSKQGCMMCHQGTSDDNQAIKQHVKFLTQKKLEGRQTGSHGELLATQYVADFLRQNGYVSLKNDGDFFQKFTFLTPNNHKKKQQETF